MGHFDDDTSADALPVSEDRLLELIASYGADPTHWPVAERAAAQARVERSDAARRAIDEAHRLDMALDQLTPPAPSVELVARLGRRMPADKWPSWTARLKELLSSLYGGRLMPRPAMMLASMAAVFAIGVVVGWSAGNQPGLDTGPSDVFVFSLVGGGEDQVLIADPNNRGDFSDTELTVALH